jgi:hypothetical protein
VGIAHITSIGKNEIELGDTKIPIGENYKKEADSIRNLLNQI